MGLIAQTEGLRVVFATVAVMLAAIVPLVLLMKARAGGRQL
jgi:hypothetical protein